MTERSTSNFDEPDSGSSDVDGPSSLGYELKSDEMSPPTQQVDVSEFATGHVDALAWSEEGPLAADEPTQYLAGDPPTEYLGQDPHTNQPYPEPMAVGPYGPNGPWNNAEPPAIPWYRATSTLVVAGLLALGLAGGGVAYTLTGTSENKAPATKPAAPPSVAQPVPQQNQNAPQSPAAPISEIPAPPPAVDPAPSINGGNEISPGTGSGPSEGQAPKNDAPVGVPNVAPPPNNPQPVVAPPPENPPPVVAPPVNPPGVIPPLIPPGVIPPIPQIVIPPLIPPGILPPLPEKAKDGSTSGTEKKPTDGTTSGTEKKPTDGSTSGTEKKPTDGSTSGTEKKPTDGGNTCAQSATCASGTSG